MNSASTQVPTIDIAAPSASSLGALDAACTSHGFFLLTGHGLDDLIERTWLETARFFDADRSLRIAVRRSADNPLGWFDRELTKRRRDSKEVFDFIDPAGPAGAARNRWPDAPGAALETGAGFHPARFRHTLTEFFAAFSGLAQRTVSLLHDVLELPADQRHRMTGDPSTSAVRLNHYPVGDPVPEEERAELAALGATALGYHTDPGTLTLLLQDGTGGLQAETRAGEWIDVPPAPGTIVVNLADAMQVWTNDRYRAAVHRVVPMSEQRRFSIPYFSNPPRDAVVQPLEGLVDGAPRYRPFPWAEFMKARNDDNFVDLGEDTQISAYAITPSTT